MLDQDYRELLVAHKEVLRNLEKIVSELRTIVSDQEERIRKLEISNARIFSWALGVSGAVGVAWTLYTNIKH
jgi:hypothetical protein